MKEIIELGKILIPASIVLYAAYLMTRSFIQRDMDIKKSEAREKSIEIVLPIRLQAYERMTLFLERISPPNLLIRLNAPNFSARDFQKILLDDIRNEYNHNVAQQIYLSEEVWDQIKNAKENIILVINEAANQIHEDSSSLDLAKKIFEISIEKDNDTIGQSITALKKEIQQLF